MVFRVLNDKLELLLARELTLESAPLAVSVSVSIASVEDLRFFLV